LKYFFSKQRHHVGSLSLQYLRTWRSILLNDSVRTCFILKLFHPFSNRSLGFRPELFFTQWQHCVDPNQPGKGAIPLYSSKWGLSLNSLEELARNAEGSDPCLTRRLAVWDVCEGQGLAYDVTGSVMLLISPPSPWYPRVDRLLRRLLFGNTRLHRLNLVQSVTGVSKTCPLCVIRQLNCRPRFCPLILRSNSCACPPQDPVTPQGSL
jgi:hypothetical protein